MRDLKAKEANEKYYYLDVEYNVIFSWVSFIPQFVRLTTK